MHIQPITPDVDVRHIMGQGPTAAVFDTFGHAEFRPIHEGPFSWLLALQVSITYLIELRFTDDELRALTRPLRMRKKQPHHQSDEPATIEQ